MSKTYKYVQPLPPRYMEGGWFLDNLTKIPGLPELVGPFPKRTVAQAERKALLAKHGAKKCKKLA